MASENFLPLPKRPTHVGAQDFFWSGPGPALLLLLGQGERVRVTDPQASRVESAHVYVGDDPFGLEVVIPSGAHVQVV